MSMPRGPTEGAALESGVYPRSGVQEVLDSGRVLAFSLDTLIRACRASTPSVPLIAARALTTWQTAADPIIRLEADKVFVGDKEVMVAGEPDGRWILLSFMAGLRTVAVEEEATAGDLVRLATALAGLHPDLTSIREMRDWLWSDGAEGFDVTMDFGFSEGLEAAVLDLHAHQEALALGRGQASASMSADAMTMAAREVDVASARDEFQIRLEQFAQATTSGKLLLDARDLKEARDEWEDPAFFLDCQLMLSVEYPHLRCSQPTERMASRAMQLLEEAPFERALRFWTQLRARTEPLAIELNEVMEKSGVGKVLARRLMEDLAQLPAVSELIAGPPTLLSQDLATELLERCIGSQTTFRQLGELVQSVGVAQYFSHLQLGTLSPLATLALGKLLTALGASRRLLQDLLTQAPASGALRLATVMGSDFRRRYAWLMPRLVVESPPSEAVPFAESLFEDRGYDWPSEWGRLLTQPSVVVLPPPVARCLCTCIARSAQGGNLLAGLLRAGGIPAETRIAAAGALRSLPEVLAEALRWRMADMLLPADVRALLHEFRKSHKAGDR